VVEGGVVADGHAYTPRRVRTAHEELQIETTADGEVIDLTERAQRLIDGTGLHDGLCTVFVAHSTCGMTIIECEPGCNADLNTVLEAIAPRAQRWEHNVRNHDTNGHAHFRAALLGPSVSVPVVDGRLAVGTWQRVVCVDFDDRPRTRSVVVQLLGA
jgi:secondary thiamine-phosphate synthase enzyme